MQGRSDSDQQHPLPGGHGQSSPPHVHEQESKRIILTSVVKWLERLPRLARRPCVAGSVSAMAVRASRASETTGLDDDSGSHSVQRSPLSAFNRLRAPTQPQQLGPLQIRQLAGNLRTRRIADSGSKIRHGPFPFASAPPAGCSRTLQDSPLLAMKIRADSAAVCVSDLDTEGLRLADRADCATFCCARRETHVHAVPKNENAGYLCGIVR